MDAKSIIRLTQSLSIQGLCYFGIFFSLTVAARCLDGTDFGIYASSVAIASFAGSVLTAGLDRILLRFLQQDRIDSGSRRIPLSLLLPAITLNLLAFAVAGLLVATGVAAPNLLFVAALGTLVAARLTLGGFFKFTLKSHVNVVATFGLQPLIVGLLFCVMRLTAPYSEVATDIRSWIIVTLLVEAVQFAILFNRVRAHGLTIERRERHSILSESIEHAKAGIWISLLVLLAQTGLFGLSFGTLVLPSADMGFYTVALRVSQLLQFPYIGATQLLVPISSRTYEEGKLFAARKEARNMIRIALGCLLVGIVAFALFGHLALRLGLNISDPRAYDCTMILSLGNLGMAIFGIGDQIMIAMGRHRQAFWISFWCGGILFPVLGGLSFLLGFGLAGLACATAISIATRALLGYLNARQLVLMPIAAFD